MKALITFLLLTFFVTLVRARRFETPRFWPLLVMSLVFTLGYLTRRLIF